MIHGNKLSDVAVEYSDARNRILLPFDGVVVLGLHYPIAVAEYLFSECLLRFFGGSGVQKLLKARVQLDRAGRALSRRCYYLYISRDVLSVFRRKPLFYKLGDRRCGFAVGIPQHEKEISVLIRAVGKFPFIYALVTIMLSPL